MEKSFRVLLGSAFAIAVAFAFSSQAQQSTLSVPAAENTTTATTTETKPETTSKVSGGILFLLDRNARVKSTEEDSATTNFQTETHFSLKYKATEKDSFSVIQRLFYSQYAKEEEQQKPVLANLRLEHNRSGKLFSGDAALTSRITLPTKMEGRRDAHFLGMLSFIPELSYNLTPRLTVGYSGFAAFEFYDDTAQMQGAAATRATFINGAVIGYALTDKLSASYSAGIQDFRINSRRDLNHPERKSQSIETSTTVAYAATKNVNLSLSANQSSPLNKDSISPASGSPMAYEDGYTLFSRDQTTYEFAGSVKF